MRIQLNLASRPFVELGPLYLRLRILIVLLAVVAVPLWLLLSTENRKAAEAQARLDAVQQKIYAIEAQRTAFQSQMREPQNASVLSQSQFLNHVFARKAFSWTAVMMDLENVLPSGVQVLNIDPVVSSKDGKVTIRLRVSGAHDRGVDLVRNLEHSHRFLSPRLARETAESNQNGRPIEQVSTASNVNFDLLAEYNPLPETIEKPAPAKRPKSVTKTARAPRSARAPRPATRKAAAQ
ncbi:MAG TPA: fimbrial assembly protein [Acidobacteriaceae bacterium]|nr:fimbrial assembly protein [Acidobacteriaceae bacterium]